MHSQQLCKKCYLLPTLLSSTMLVQLRTRHAKGGRPAYMFRLSYPIRYKPARLLRLPDLKRLQISGCEAIQMLPNEDGLPSSPQELEDHYPRTVSQVHCKNYWPETTQPSTRCPSSMTFQSSLQELDVSNSGTEELRKQSLLHNRRRSKRFYAAFRALQKLALT